MAGALDPRHVDVGLREVAAHIEDLGRHEMEVVDWVGILMYGKKPTFPEILRWVGRA